MRTPMCAYQGERNVSFSENFAYAQNEWTQGILYLLITNDNQ